MPEGDTIWRTAERLKPALEGYKVTKMRLPRAVGTDGVEPGTVVTSVAAKGKYLLVTFSDGQVLETHMKMTGSWHLYQVGEPWKRSQLMVRASIETDSGWVAVCFGAPHVELRTSASKGDHFHLGPNLCEESPDFADCINRMDSVLDPQEQIGVALLDQRVFCGVGNVYKSEVLYQLKISPLRPVADLSPAERSQLVQTSHLLLRRNLGSGPRNTVTRSSAIGGTTAQKTAVYGKKGEPCPGCGSKIERIVQGEHVRSTYYCPKCQPR